MSNINFSIITYTIFRWISKKCTIHIVVHNMYFAYLMLVQFFWQEISKYSLYVWSIFCFMASYWLSTIFWATRKKIFVKCMIHFLIYCSFKVVYSFIGYANTIHDNFSGHTKKCIVHVYQTCILFRGQGGPGAPPARVSQPMCWIMT